MASKYWLKLYYEMLDDPKVARLPDSSYRRFVECLLLAGEYDRSGLLPPIEDMAWRLRVSETALQQDMSRLAMAGVVNLVPYEGEERWLVRKFKERQQAVPGRERVARYRDRQKSAEYTSSNENVTNRYTDTDTDKDKIVHPFDSWQQFSAWHAGKKQFSDLHESVQDTIRRLGGDGAKKQPAHFYKREFNDR